MELIGATFTDGIRDYKVLEYMDQFKMYRLENYTDNKNNVLMSKEEIEEKIKDKEKYEAKKEKRIAYEKKVAEEQKEEAQAEKIALEEYNNNYGFTEKKTALQKSKILKALNSSIVYAGKLYTYKDLIINIIKKNDCHTQEYFNTNRYSKKKINGCHEKLVDKMEYRLWINNKTFIELNKTGFLFATYLIDNKII